MCGKERERGHESCFLSRTFLFFRRRQRKENWCEKDRNIKDSWGLAACLRRIILMDGRAGATLSLNVLSFQTSFETWTTAAIINWKKLLRLSVVSKLEETKTLTKRCHAVTKGKLRKTTLERYLQPKQEKKC